MDASAKMHRSRFGNLKKPRTSVSGIAKVAAKLWSVARDKDIFDAKLSIQAFAGIVWLFTSSLHLSADKASLILGVGNRVIRYIFQQLANFFVPLIDKLNGSLVLGGIGEDIELDEISFRSVGRRFGIVAPFLVVRRGSSLVWIHRLPSE